MFTHLHVHSYFSFESGVSSPEALLDAAAQRGFQALACTDTNGVYGAVEFQQAALARGIRPILGAHLVFGDEEAVVLATDEKGWGAVCRAATWVHWNERMEEWRNGGSEANSSANSAIPPFPHSAIRNSTFQREFPHRKKSA